MTAAREGKLFDLESKYLSAVYAADLALTRNLSSGETPELRLAFHDAVSVEAEAKREMLRAHRVLVGDKS